jgi:hypothetical protein
MALVQLKGQGGTALRWLLIASSAALLVAAYHAGVARGLDRYIAPYAAGPFLHATCAVATKWLTGIGDYVCLRNILDMLQPIHGIMYDLGLREYGPSWGYHSWDYLFNRDFVDRALQQLFAHPHWTVPPTTSGPPYNGIQGIGWGMDEGHYNFVNLAYHVFGPSIEALYRAYWLVFGVSALTFVLAYRRALAPLVLVLVIALVQYMIFSTSFLWFTDGMEATTEPANPRFLSCLCIVPLLHYVIAAHRPVPLRWRDASALLMQALVLGLAMLQRTTVLWVPIALVLLAALCWLWRWRWSAPGAKRSFSRIAGLAVTVAVATQAYLHSATHPGFAANGYTHGHNVWFGLFYELQTHPDWRRRYAAQYAGKDGDFLPDYAWRRYLAEHREEWPRWNPNGADPFQIGITQVGVEELCRKAFFEFAGHDPKFVAEVWLIHNPRTLVSYTRIFLKHDFSWVVPLPLIALLGLGLICSLVGSRPAVREVITYAPLVAYLCAMAALPNVASLIIPESLTDYFTLLAIAVAIGLVALGAGIGALVAEKMHGAATGAAMFAHRKLIGRSLRTIFPHNAPRHP